MSVLGKFYLPSDRLNCWQWNERYTDFALVPSYDTPFKVRYDANLFPYWKQPQEAITDPSRREIVVLKNSRAAVSENLLLNAIRFTVCNDPMPILYLGAQQEWTEKFHKERIVLGLRASRPSAAKLDRAELAGTTITFDDCSVTSGYPGSKSVTKGFGFGLVLGDEVSTWAQYTADMIRKRTDTYRYAHIVLVSSPDPQQNRPSDKDPIFVEYESGDCRKWHMPDPKTGELFAYEMGAKDTLYGLKWDQGAKRGDGTWDLDRVKASAHYVTPSGTRIDEADRFRIAKEAEASGGGWVATNANGVPGKLSYHINAFYMPFRSCEFGNIAASFLEAVRKGPEFHRVFVYEYLAERWYGEKLITEESVVKERQTSVPRRTRFSQSDQYKTLMAGRKTFVPMTVDVQLKRRVDNLYWEVSEWGDSGDSCRIDYGTASTWDEIAGYARRYGVSMCKHGPAIFIDNSYEDRADEVFEQCTAGVLRGSVPMYGRANLKELIRIRNEDPYEKTARAGRAIPMITFNPNRIKNVLWQLMGGTHERMWLLPSGDISDLLLHYSGEVCIDREWKELRKDIHWKDCAVMSLVAAMCMGYFRTVDTLAAAEDVAGAVAASTPPAPPRRRTGVFQPA